MTKVFLDAFLWHTTHMRHLNVWVSDHFWLGQLASYIIQASIMGEHWTAEGLWVVLTAHYGSLWWIRYPLHMYTCRIHRCPIPDLRESPGAQRCFEKEEESGDYKFYITYLGDIWIFCTLTKIHWMDVASPHQTACIGKAILQSGMLLGWVPMVCTCASGQWHLYRWHLVTWISANWLGHT